MRSTGEMSTNDNYKEMTEITNDKYRENNDNYFFFFLLKL